MDGSVMDVRKKLNVNVKRESIFIFIFRDCNHGEGWVLASWTAWTDRTVKNDSSSISVLASKN